MPWTQKQMLRDANGDLIPQYWDVVEQEFKPLTGSDGANDVRLTGSTVEELIMDGVEIAPKSTSEILDLNNKGESNFRGFYFAVRSDTSNYSVDIIWNVYARSYFTRFREQETFTATSERYVSDFIKLKTIRPQIRITNNSDSPSVFDCHVLWVK